MSDVMRALSRLGKVVRNLEGSVDHLESSLSGEQRDMFSAPPANTNASDIDKDKVVKKLDLAISKIEDILEEDQKQSGGVNG